MEDVRRPRGGATSSPPAARGRVEGLAAHRTDGCRPLRSSVAAAPATAGGPERIQQDVPGDHRPVRHSFEHLPRVTHAAEPCVGADQGGARVDVGGGPRDAILDEECVDLLGLRRSGGQARAGAERYHPHAHGGRRGRSR